VPTVHSQNPPVRTSRMNRVGLMRLVERYDELLGIQPISKSSTL
jgi:hypothetical protein